jgi:hypothetical protein
MDHRTRPRGGKKGGNNRSTTVQLRARQREAEIVERRLRGETFDTIATALSMSTGGCADAYERALNRVSYPTVVRAREEQLQRLDLLRRKGWARANAKHPPISALEFLLRLEERQARLLGLDSDTRFDGSGPVAVDADEMTRLIQSNLSVDEQRQMLHLMRKARGLPSVPSYGYGCHSSVERVAASNDSAVT